MQAIGPDLQSHSRRAWLPAFAAIFACSWGGNHFSPLLLLYKQEEGYSAALVNLLLGFYVVGLAPSLLIAARPAARYGRRPIMLVGLGASLVASTFLALSPTVLALMFVGRLFAGITVGIAMSVGTTWIKELSKPERDPSATSTSGAQRGSLAFTLGAAVGAFCSGAWAQLTPWGEVAPYLVHIAVTIAAAACVVVGGVETRPSTVASVSSATKGRILGTRLRPRFTQIVMVAAPWIFVSAGLAYGYFPVLMRPHSGAWAIGYATLLGAITLGTAACVQPLAVRLHSAHSARGILIALGMLIAGMTLLAVASAVQSLPIGLVACVVVGAGVGTALVTAMLEVERIADEFSLAHMAGAFYATAYIGFLAPAVVAVLVPQLGLIPVFAGVVSLAVISFVVVLLNSRRHLNKDSSSAAATTDPTPLTWA